MKNILRYIDSLILDIYQDIDLEEKEKKEADKVIEDIISLYPESEIIVDGEKKESNKKSWWFISKTSKTSKPKKNKKLYILT